MRTTKQGFALATMIATVFAAAISTGCKGSNEITNPLVTASAAPVPAGELSGRWRGSWDTIDYKGSSADCHTHVEASATLVQNGSEITGHLRINHDACWGGGEVRATVSNGILTGRVLLPGYTGGEMTGTATTARIDAVVEHLSHDNGDGTGSVAPGGHLTLAR